ncbi:MAG: cyclopropane-fatty-acyl-phospholipid synthase family protein [Gammaproteobacteria bacterium]|nr:cyclopropane-fatty-acyl-phospholipid synthase family protein [Gammaproteobacteria bacterium]
MSTTKSELNTNISVMKNTNAGVSIKPGNTIKPRRLDGIAKKVLLKQFSLIMLGEITINDGDERYHFGNKTDDCALSVTLDVIDSRFYADVCFGGSIGASEAYMCGYWTTNNLTDLIRIFSKNKDTLDTIESGFAYITVPIQKILHWFNRNTQKGSRKNIAAHYDIGNDLFKIMLDETMMYSSAIFSDENMSLYDAQINRLDEICKNLDLQDSDELLEIGTGWGALSIHAAKKYGCNVTTTTISREQYNLACERVEREGLTDKITVLFEDYRHLTGKFDKLVSVEMIEAVGHQYYETYFNKCSELLKPSGMMLLQAITIADQQYEAAKTSVDFIKRYIFPGSCIPSITAMQQAITHSSDLRLYKLNDIGPHYATTLNHWRKNIDVNIDEVKKLGYSEEFLKMWEFYLCYCEGGFIERVISDVHMLLVKPNNRCQHLL